MTPDSTAVDTAAVPSVSVPRPQPYPRVGVGVFVFDEQGRFIVGERMGSHGAGTLALAGGHLELHETFSECAARETLEETGLEIRDIRFLTAVNNIFPEGQHYVTIFMGARRIDERKEFEVLEPTKCAYWKWTTQSDLMIEEARIPKLFLSVRNLFFGGEGDAVGEGFDAWKEYQRKI